MSKYKNIKKEFTPYILGDNSKEEVIAIAQLLQKHGKTEHPRAYYLRIATDAASTRVWYELWKEGYEKGPILTEGDFIFEEVYNGMLLFDRKTEINFYYTEVADKKGVYIPKEEIITAFQIDYSNNDDLLEIMTLIENNNKTTSFVNTMELKRKSKESNDIICIIKQGNDINATSDDFIILDAHNNLYFMSKDNFLNKYELIK